jgi:hypothetical protein
MCLPSNRRRAFRSSALPSFSDSSRRQRHRDCMRCALQYAAPHGKDGGETMCVQTMMLILALLSSRHLSSSSVSRPSRRDAVSRHRLRAAHLPGPIHHRRRCRLLYWRFRHCWSRLARDRPRERVTESRAPRAHRRRAATDADACGRILGAHRWYRRYYYVRVEMRWR